MSSTLFQVGIWPTPSLLSYFFIAYFKTNCSIPGGMLWKIKFQEIVCTCLHYGLYGCVSGRYSEHWSKTLLDKLTLMFISIRKPIPSWGTFLAISLFANRNLVQSPFSWLLCNRKWKEFFGGFEFFFMKVTVKIIILWNVVPCLTGRYQNVVMSKNSVIFISSIAWTYCLRTDWIISRCT
jgi:hypothetical protein